jgi:hypothetical protein
MTEIEEISVLQRCAKSSGRHGATRSSPFLANVSAITITMKRLAPSPHIIPPTCSNMAVKGSPLCRIISIKTLVFYILHRYRSFQNKFSICAYGGCPCLLLLTSSARASSTESSCSRLPLPQCKPPKLTTQGIRLSSLTGATNLTDPLFEASRRCLYCWNQ